MDLEKILPQWNSYREWIIAFNKREEDVFVKKWTEMFADKSVTFQQMHEYNTVRPKPLRPTFEGFMDWLSNQQVEVTQEGHDVQCSSGVGGKCDCWRAVEDEVKKRKRGKE